MGKRSNFPRRKQDDYRTPFEGAEPLIPHLPNYAFTFLEPCAGDAQLIQHIETLRPDCLCIEAWDIEPKRFDIRQADALQAEIPKVDLIITNPPWTRKVLHPMIARFSFHAPTWLLFDSDWIFTKQANPFRPWLKKVVPTKRIKWIPDSPYSAKDNTCWYLFDQHSNAPFEFAERAA